MCSLNHWATSKVPKGWVFNFLPLAAFHTLGWKVESSLGWALEKVQQRAAVLAASPTEFSSVGSTLWPFTSVATAATAPVCHGCLISSHHYPEHLCCLSLLRPSPHHTAATVSGSTEIVRMPSKCLTQFTRNSYSQPRRPMRSDGHEAGKHWEECGERQAAVLREFVWMLKWLSELTTLRILRRQNSSQRSVKVMRQEYMNQEAVSLRVIIFTFDGWTEHFVLVTEHTDLVDNHWLCEW